MLKKITPRIVTIAANSWIWGAISLVFVALIAVPVVAQAPKARIIMADGTIKELNMDPHMSAPWCGAQGLAPCAGAPAKFEHAARGTCPSGSFFDLGKWQCWSCPRGYTRSVHPVDGSRACKKKVGNTLGYDVSKATFAGPLCPKGSFYDPIRGGECWSCPHGYTRSLAHIDQSNACYIPAKEVFAKATKKTSNAFAWDCPKGTFWDGYGPGCYQCPRGYKRTAAHIKEWNACSKAVGEKTAHAKQVKKAECGPGEFYDMKIPGKQDPATGGGCWTCRAGYQRTAHPVDGPRACAKEKELDFKSAKFESALTCPAGQYFDFINLTQQDINTRPETRGRTDVKPIARGTCWSCPPGFSRSMASVKSDKACEATLGWYTAPFKEPGLFGLAGAQEVLFGALERNPRLVQQALEVAAKSRARLEKKSQREALGKEKKIFTDNPQHSAVASGIVLTRLLVALASPQKATNAEKRLVESFKNYVIARRTYIAQDAIDQYKAWKARPRYTGSKVMVSNPLASLVSDMPDFGANALLGVLASQSAQIAAGLVIPHSEILSVALSAAGNGFEDFNHPAKAAGFVARNGVELVIGNAASKVVEMVSEQALTRMGAMGIKNVAGLSMSRLASGVGKMAYTEARAAQFMWDAGPQAVVAVGLLIVQRVIEFNINQANAPHQLNAMLGSAKSDPQLLRLAKTPEGMRELITLWSNAVAGDSRLSPRLMAVYRGRVEKALFNGRMQSAPPRR